MEIFVNGREIQTKYSIPHNLGAILDLISDDVTLAPGSVISEIRVDGQELLIGDEGLEGTRIQPENVSKLEIRIEHPEQMLHRVLVDGVEFCEMVNKMCLNVAGLFRKADMGAANRELAVLLERFSLFAEFVDRLRGYSQQMGALGTQKDEFGETLTRLATIIDQCQKAQLAQDWLLLADILEFEIIELLDQFKAKSQARL